jgi:hypothetical protein
MGQQGLDLITKILHFLTMVSGRRKNLFGFGVGCQSGARIACRPTRTTRGVEDFESKSSNWTSTGVIVA